MPGDMECITAFLQHFLYTTASLGLTHFKSFKSPNTLSTIIGFPFVTLSGEGFLWSHRASHARGNHLLPPPNSLCNTSCSMSSVPQTTVMAQKGRLCWWAPMPWMWQIFRSVVASDLFCDSENLMHRGDSWCKERSLLSFLCYDVVSVETFAPLHWGNQTLLVAWVSNCESKWTNKSCLKDENAVKEPGTSF